MFNIRFNGGESFNATFSPLDEMAARFSDTILKPIGEFFEGAYEYTPSAEEQRIPIDGMVATADIVVHAIPNNYGLVTWDGRTITVS